MVVTEPKIKWVIKKSKSEKSDADVNVSLRKTKGEIKNVAIVFKNGTYKDLNKTGYLRIGTGMSGIRMYFMPANAEQGYTLQQIAKTKNYCLIVKATSELVPFKGAYDLNLDENNLFYIDRREVKA